MKILLLTAVRVIRPIRPDNKCLCRLAALALTMFLVVARGADAKEIGKFTVERERKQVIVKAPDGKEILRYQLERDADTGLSVDSGCYFHPLNTPGGTTITEVAPADHPHHRGVFLAWVEMHGKKDADFWGWGEHAPKQHRKIVNRKVTALRGTKTNARFRARNEWLAEGERVISENLGVSIRQDSSANVIDLTFTLTADHDITVSRWAFSGFVFERARMAS